MQWLLKAASSKCYGFTDLREKIILPVVEF